MIEERVFIAGAGPVGLVAAARLTGAGIPVTVFETGEDLSTESRASTFHPATLDMLAEIGAAESLIAQGLKAPHLQYRISGEGLIARFDFGEIADLTGHPYRVQSEQWKLTRILLEQLRDKPDFEIVFSTSVERVAQDEAGVTVTLRSGEATRQRSGRWLIGADGARSNVRHSIGVEFEGFTWPERFLVLSTPYEFQSVIPDLDFVSYVADPERWHFLLRIPEVWRVMFPIPAGVSDDTALDPAYGQGLLKRVVPGVSHFEVSHRTLYRVHQRVAEKFRVGRCFLAGDAAHINNPLGGMGMNGGIHDAMNLTERLIAVWNDAAPESVLDGYDLQRRLVTVEYVQARTIQNKRDLEAADEESRAGFRDRMRAIATNPERTRSFLKDVSMISSLERARELA